MILATIQRRNTTRQQDVQNFRYKIVLSNLVLREKHILNFMLLSTGLNRASD